MKRVLHFLALPVAITIVRCTTETTSVEEKKLQPPDPQKIPQELTAHGMKRVDNYYWMKLSEEQKNARVKDEQTNKVIEYLEAENDYLSNMMKHT